MPARVLLSIAAALFLLTSCDDHSVPSAPSSGAPPVALTPRFSTAPHEPPGFAVLTDWPWDALSGGGWTNTSVNGGDANIHPDLTTPGTLVNVLTGLENHSLLTGTYGASVLEHALGQAPVNAVDAAYWFRVGPGFSGARKLNNLSPQATWIVHADDGQLITAVELDGNADNSHLPLEARDGATHLLMPNLGAGVVSAAQWHRVEVLFRQSSTPTSRDGSVEWWLDNVAVGHYDSVNVSTGFSRFAIDLTGLRLPDILSYDDTRLSVPAGTPGALSDFSVWYATDHSAHVVFTSVDDGAGQPARYQFRFYLSGAWETGTVSTDVQCTTLPGTGQQSCNVNGMGARQSWSVQAAAYRVNSLSDTTWGPPSDALFAHTAPESGANVVTTLSSPGSGDDYIDVSFRAVADSAGSQTPARYRLRMMPTPLSWNAATQVTSGTCSGDPAPPLVVDSVYVCRITGLTPGTSYQLEMYTRRVRPGEADVYGDLSNIATGVTTGTTPPP